MLIHLSEIMSVKDKVQHVVVPIDMECFKLDGTEYSFVNKNPMDLTITCTGDRKVFVEGSAKVSLMLPCSRCLEDVEIPFDIEVSKELDFRESSQDRIDDLDEINYIEGYNLDVDRLVCNEILLDFPMKVLCSDDCKGICNVCGTNLNKGTCQCDRTVIDPRMSVFQDVFEKFKEV